MRVWRFDREDEPGSPLIVDQVGLRAVLDELENSDVGDCFTIHVEDMADDKFKALPEWDGW